MGICLNLKLDINDAKKALVQAGFQTDGVAAEGKNIVFEKKVGDGFTIRIEVLTEPTLTFELDASMIGPVSLWATRGRYPNGFTLAEMHEREILADPYEITEMTKLKREALTAVKAVLDSELQAKEEAENLIRKANNHTSHGVEPLLSNHPIHIDTEPAQKRPVDALRKTFKGAESYIY